MFSTLESGLHENKIITKSYDGFTDRNTNEGLFCVFAKPQDAIECAHAILRAIESVNRIGNYAWNLPFIITHNGECNISCVYANKFEAGVCAYNQRNYKEAKEIFEFILKYIPDDKPSFVYFNKADEKMKEINKANRHDNAFDIFSSVIIMPTKNSSKKSHGNKLMKRLLFKI